MAMMSSMTGSMMARHWQMPVQQPWERKLQGFSRKVLVKQPVPSEYICGLCDLLLRQPMQNLCGHRFCMVCVYEKKEVACPLCLQETDEALRMDTDSMMVGQNNVHPDNALRRTLVKQPARCTNCDWSGSYEEYETSHYQECKLHKVLCPYCAQRLVVEKLEEHKANFCPKREMPCTQCGLKVPAAELALHLTEQCPKGLVQCDSCSTAPMTRESLAEHYESTCPVHKIPCPYGCVFVFIEPSKLEDHEREEIYHHTKHENSRINELESVQSTDDNIDVSEAIPEMTNKLQELERKVQAKTRHGGSSAPVNPNDMGGRVNQVQQMSIEGYEKLGRVSCLLENVQDDSDALQLKLAQTQKGNDRVAEMVETHNQTLDQTFESLKERLRVLEETSYNGSFLWTVTNFSFHLTRARNQQQRMLHSPIFYTSKYGYGLRLRLFPNGDGIATGTHLSLYVQSMAGEYDVLLQWPFRQKVTFTIKNQQRPGVGDITSVFEPDNSTALRKPSRLSNSAGGSTHFANVRKFDEPSEFVVNDTLFIQCVVDVSGLN